MTYKEMFQKPDEWAEGQIHVTTDYSIFKLHPQNRTVTAEAAAKIRESIVRWGWSWSSPMIVDANMNVADGQHRLEICMQLKLPVYFVKNSSITMEMVRDLNTHRVDWSIEDFVHSRAANEETSCIGLEKIASMFNITIKDVLLVGFQDRLRRQIRNGSFKFDFDKKAKEIGAIIRFITQVQDIVGESYLPKRPAFLSSYSLKKALAMIKRISGFEEEEFLRRLRNSPKSLTHRYGYSEYLSDLIGIYNYRQQERFRIEAKNLSTCR